jgi:hypothetical protein
MPHSVSRFACIVGFAFGLLVHSVEVSAQVVSLDPNYTVSRLATGLQIPAGILYRPATNDLLVTQFDLGTILTVDASTGATGPFVDVKPFAHSTRGHWVAYLASNSSGELFVPIYEDGPVLRFSPTGQFLGSFGFSNLYGAAFDSNDNFYTASGSPTTTILRFPAKSLSSPTVYAGGFGSLSDIAINATDELVVPDRPRSTLWQVTPGCVAAACHTVLAGGVPGFARVAVDPVTQAAFASDEFGNVIRATGPGVFNPFARGFTQGSNSPLGFDTAGNLYAADIPSGTIWKFTRRIAASTLQIQPNHGGNTGTVTVNVIGSGIQGGATVKLTGLGNDILGSSVTIVNGSNFTATFDLSGAPSGARSLVVTNPDGTTAALANGFTVEEGGASDIHVDIIGLDKIRIGRAQTYFLAVSNTGNLDGIADFVSISVPSGVSADPGSGPDLFSVGSSADPAFAIPSPDHANDTNFVFATAGVPAGGTQMVPISLTVPTGVAGFTMIASDPVLTNISFDVYAASQGVPFIHEHPCKECDLANLPVAEALAASDAQHALEKYQSDLSAAQKAAARILADVGSAVAKAGIVLAAKNALKLTPAQEVVLGFEIAAGFAILKHILFDDPSLDIDGLLSDFKNKGFAASIALAAKRADTRVAVFIGTTDLAVAAINASISFNRAAATLKADRDDFDFRFLLYRVAWQNYKDCLKQYCNVVINPGPPPCLPGTTCVPVTPVGSLDPNDKTGALGAGILRYVSGATPLRYAVYFANQESATAPAQDVSITDQLDVTKDNITTLSLGTITFGSQLVSPPPFQKTFATTVDLRPAQNLLVAISAKLNSATGLLSWTFKSLDPSTGLPPTDPTAGFLPPGGEGSAFFTVTPKQGLPNDTQIQNQATIVFDVNPPINTATWTNTLDNTPPSSHVLALPATETSTGFTVQWTGSDVGSGVQDFNIYVSDNGGTFTPLLSNAAATSSTFTGQAGHSYGFYSIARDLVGNIEGGKTVAEATTQVVIGDTTPPVIIPSISGTLGQNGWYVSNVTVTWSVTDPESGIASSSGCNATTLTADTGGVTLTCTATNGAGLTSSVPVTIKIDKTPPTITGTRTPGPNANDWNNSAVTITFQCSDALSGLAPGSPPAPTVVPGQGAGQSVKGTCTDLAGNVASLTVNDINIDLTPPVVTCAASPNGLWPPNNKLVPIAVTVNVSDALSGPSGFSLVSVASSEPDSGAGDIQGFTVGSASTAGLLRAQRLGSGVGRVYTFGYTGSDRAGNTASCATTVTVPHDQGK